MHLIRTKIRTFLECHQLVGLGLLSGILLSIGYRVPGAYPLLFVALLPLLHAVFTSRTIRGAALAATVAGIPFMTTALGYFFSIYPLPKSFGFPSSAISIVLIVGIFVLEMIVLLIASALWGAAVRACKGMGSWRWMILAPTLLWPVSEYVRQVIFNIYTFNPTIPNPVYYSIGMLGYALIDSPNLGQLAAYGGLFVCGMFFVLINTLIYCLLRLTNRRRRMIGIASIFAILIVLSIIPFRQWRSENYTRAHDLESIKVAVVSIQYPKDGDEWDYESEIHTQEIGFVRQASNAGVIVIPLPEGSELFTPFSTSTPTALIGTSSPLHIVDSGPVTVPDKTVRVRAFNDLATAQSPIRDKRILTAFGEYIPSIFAVLMRSLGFSTNLAQFQHARGYVPGVGDGAPFTVQNAQASVLFCLENSAPGIAAKIVKNQGDTLLILVNSFSIFRHSWTMEQDALRAMRAHAMQGDAPIISATLAGPAYAVDAEGRVLSAVGEDGISEMQIIDLPVASAPTTPYAH